MAAFESVVERLHDVLYDPALKVSRFGLAGLGTLWNSQAADYPPVNGRIAKALFVIWASMCAAA